MNTSLYKKSGWVTSMLARELLTSKEGDRCPTIAYCTENFHVSRGTVQDSFAALEHADCLRTVKHGQSGTVIEMLDKSKMFKFANLDSLTATMPVPLNGPLGGLATAICRCMMDSPLPFTFAFIEGAGKRVKALLRMNYDFVVVSAMTAKTFLEKHSELEIAMTLNHCLYSNEYVLCINRPEAAGLEDGMVLACDPNCTDQVTLISKLSQGKNIIIKDTPYTACRAALLNYEVDGIVYRYEEWLDEFNSVKKIVLVDEMYTQRDMNTPVILTNINNYGIKKLIQYALDEEKIHDVQQLVLDKKMRAQYY